VIGIGVAKREGPAKISGLIVLAAWLLIVSPILLPQGSVVADPPFTTDVMVNDAASTGDSASPSIATGPDGRLYAIWSDGRVGPSDFRIFFSGSTDGGATWMVPSIRVGDDIVGSYQSDGSIALNSTGALFATWSDWRSGNADIYFAKSLDGGLSWTTPNTKVNAEPSSANQFVPSIATDLLGNVYVAWVDERGGGQDIFVGKSSDGGATWTERNVIVEPANFGQHAPSIAVDGSGNVYVAWQDGRNGNLDIYFARSVDGGMSWSNPNIQITTNSEVQFFPASAADAAGSVYIIWRDQRNGDLDIYLAKSPDGGTTWMDPQVRVNSDTGSSPQFDASITLDAGGIVHAAWTDLRNGSFDTYSASSFDGGQTWTTPDTRVSDYPAASVQQSPAISGGSAGHVSVTWVDNRNGNYDVFVATADVPPTPPSAPQQVHASLVGGGQDVVLTWRVAQPEVFVDHYEVWRGDAYSPVGDGYSLLPAGSNLAPGTATFIDSSTMSGQSHYYEIQAVGLGGRAAGDFQAAKIVRPLSSGMALVGIPLELQDISIEAAFQSLTFDIVRMFDASDPVDPWKAYLPTQGVREFDTVGLEHGFWINVTAGEWRVAGRVVRMVSVGLHLGWNLLCYPSIVPRSINVALGGLAISRVELFDPTAPPYFLRNGMLSDNLTPGSGFWAHADAKQTWNLTS